MSAPASDAVGSVSVPGPTAEPAPSRAGAPSLPQAFTAPARAVEVAVATGSIPVLPIVPSQRPRARRGARAVEPLGSIALAPARTDPGTRTCVHCGSDKLTNLRLTLTDGSPVIFVSCHACEHKGWFALDGSGEGLSLESVLGSSTKRR